MLAWVRLLQVLIPLDSYLLTVSIIGQEWNALDNSGDAQDGAQ